MKKYGISILIFFFTSSLIWSQNQNDVLKIRKAKEDSLWQVRNDFLNDSIFIDLNYQDSLFKAYEGLWKCVKIEENRYATVKYPTNRDILFSENKMWYLDYPCSMDGYKEDVHLRNDSIFLSTPYRVYIEKKRIEFRSDTLVIFSDRIHGQSKFYLKKEYDEQLISELREKRFNSTCIQGDWSLASINDGGSDEWVIKDGYHTHVPRHINFESGDVKIQGIYLITSDLPIGKFEILQFSRYFDEKYGETGILEVKELEKRNGIHYHYSFELDK